jgi:SAM-dependent methyltransferase
VSAPERGESFDRVQREHFDRADAAHFAWATSAPGFCDVEDDLIAPFLPLIAAPCLEIGCGEGNNLVRLARRVHCFGVDLYHAKLVFAARQLPGVGFATADALALPFAGETFSSVFLRDVLHHIETPERVLEEAVRVLAPGGRLCLLEPNGRNPLNYIHTFAIRAEHGVRRSNEAHIRRLLEPLPLADLEIWLMQPLPLRRLVLHHSMGFPALGRRAPLRSALAAVERALGMLLPRSRWTYIAAAARRAD